MAKRKPSTIGVPVEEKHWRARADACTLAEADAIKKDQKRLAAAKKAAKNLVTEKEQQAQEAQKSAKAMKRLAK